MTRPEHARRQGATLAECARELGVSVERCRQIEASALRKLRHWCSRHGIAPHLLLDIDRPTPD
jgi:DNA-directed RNA polymerase sigma subunit (sigma70/sigma32)